MRNLMHEIETSCAKIRWWAVLAWNCLCWTVIWGEVCFALLFWPLLQQPSMYPSRITHTFINTSFKVPIPTSVSQAPPFLLSLQHWALWMACLPETSSSLCSPAFAQSCFPSHLSDCSFFVYLCGFPFSIPPFTMVFSTDFLLYIQWPPLQSWSQLLISILSSEFTSTALVCLVDRCRYLAHSGVVWWLRAQAPEPDCSVWIPVLPLTHWGILGKLLNLSLPSFPQGWKEDNKSTYLKGLLWWLNGFKVVQQLEQSLAPGQCHVNVNSRCWHHTWGHRSQATGPSCGWPRRYLRVIVTHGALVARNMIGFLHVPGFLISSLPWSLEITR